MKKWKLALLDLYNGEPNQGMRAIREILAGFKDELDYKEFDLRVKGELPDESFDIYISSGGPGDPLEGDGVWDRRWNDLVSRLWQINRSGAERKYVFFICHSFQMACAHFRIGKICRRNKRSFGTFPVHKTRDGKDDPLFRGLPDPFWIADFRDFQVIRPDFDSLEALGARIIALERVRSEFPDRRAIMGVRFSNEFVGTQFHPEADPEGMRKHFLDPDRQQSVIEEYGGTLYYSMLSHLEDPGKIPLTHQVVLPGFIASSLKELNKERSLAEGA